MAPPIRPVRDSDLPAVAALLADCGLPAGDIGAHFGAFLVLEEGGRVAGSIGLERCGEDGLLRSLAVSAHCRRRGHAGRLVQALIDKARREGVRALYLLTETAERYFAGRGFRPVPRDDAPPAVRATREFSGLCPQSAVLMKKDLG